jgi:hypothetical protein
MPSSAGTGTGTGCSRVSGRGGEWATAATVLAGPIQQVVIFVPEDHPTDNYFASTVAYGANAASPGHRRWEEPTLRSPPRAGRPAADLDRDHAEARWRTDLYVLTADRVRRRLSCLRGF